MYNVRLLLNLYIYMVAILKMAAIKSEIILLIL